MRFFDTHAHLNDESFDTDRAALIEGLPSCGAELIMDVACAVEDFEKTLEITAEYPFIYGAYGIHPHYASDPGENWEARLRRALCDKKAACLGEIGLDYHYDLSEKDDQKKLFDYQLKLAKELGLSRVTAYKGSIRRRHGNTPREQRRPPRRYALLQRQRGNRARMP